MKKIRKNVFETNSSSTHSICIARNVDYEIPATLHLKFGEFGWAQDSLNSSSEKASYLYTGIVNHFPQYLDKLINTLTEKGITVTTQELNEEDSWDNGYVDHGGDMDDFIRGVMDSEEELFSYLFSGLSFVLTGNDNSDNDVDITVTYDHVEYYKGN